MRIFIILVCLLMCVAITQTSYAQIELQHLRQNSCFSLICSLFWLVIVKECYGLVIGFIEALLIVVNLIIALNWGANPNLLLTHYADIKSSAFVLQITAIGYGVMIDGIGLYAIRNYMLLNWGNFLTWCRTL